MNSIHPCDVLRNAKSKINRSKDHKSEISTGRRPMRSESMPTDMDKILPVKLNVKKASGIREGSILVSCPCKAKRIREIADRKQG